MIFEKILPVKDSNFLAYHSLEDILSLENEFITKIGIPDLFIGFGCTAYAFEVAGRVIKSIHDYQYTLPTIPGILQPLYRYQIQQKQFIELPFAEMTANRRQIYECRLQVAEQGYLIIDDHDGNFGILEESDRINLPGDCVFIDSSGLRAIPDNIYLEVISLLWRGLLGREIDFKYNLPYITDVIGGDADN